MTIYGALDASIGERVSAMNRVLETSHALEDSAAGAAQPDPTSPDLSTATALASSATPSQTLARATELEQARDWPALSQLDAALASIDWQSLSRPRAVLLRAERRSHVTAPASRKTAGEECIAMLDEVIIVQPTLALYGERAQCGLLAERNDVVIESLWSLGNGVYGSAREQPPEQRATARRTLQTLITALEQNLPIARTAAFDAARRDEVALKLRAHIARLQ
jgi:hypothetical protein